MTSFEWITLMLSVLAVVVIPLIAVLVRGVVKWTRIEGKVDALAVDLKEFMMDKEKAHTLIYSQMKDDRDATNRRLRWLEEHLWKGSGNAV